MIIRKGGDREATEPYGVFISVQRYVRISIFPFRTPRARTPPLPRPRHTDPTNQIAANGSVPSPNGTLIASIVPPKLVVRSASTLHVQRVINLNPRFAANVKFMKWSPVPSNDVISAAWNGFWCKRRSGIDNSEEEGTITQRVLLADSDIIQVFDVKDEKWTATISQGFGGIKNVEFGRNADEVVVFSEFQVGTIRCCLLRWLGRRTRD